MTQVILVACGGALGAMARFLTVIGIQTLFRTPFPFGTLFVNGLGALLIGCIMALLLERMSFDAENWRMFMVVGFLGAYTTFSSFAWESLMLYQDGNPWGALINFLSNNFLSLLGVVVGLKLGRLIGA